MATNIRLFGDFIGQSTRSEIEYARSQDKTVEFLEEASPFGLAAWLAPWGLGVTYSAYGLLLLSLIGFFFQKDTVFRKTLSRVLQSSAFLLLLFGKSSNALIGYFIFAFTLAHSILFTNFATVVKFTAVKF